MQNTVTTPVVKGLIISLILIVFQVAIYFAGQSTNQALGSLQYLILIGGIIWACISYAKQMDHNVTFGNVFSHGFKTNAVVTVITIIYSVIAIKFLFPDMMDMMLEKSREAMEQRNMSEEQTDQALEMTQKFMIPFAIGGILLVFMIVGAIASLIGAAVAKKNPNAGPFNQAG